MRNHPKAIAKKQAGMSLVELMIGLVLGLIVISAVFNTYLGSTRSSRFSQGLQQMQENGRYGIATLQRGIRLAGFSTTGNEDPFDLASSRSDVIVARTQSRYDCNGAETAAFGGIAVNRYAHNSTDNTITCTGNAGGVEMPVVEGVEAFRVLWGVDRDFDGTPESYVPHGLGFDVDSVVALRVAILVNSGEPIRTRRGQETHVLFDLEVETDDKIARSVFTSTVMLRNKE